MKGNNKLKVRKVELSKKFPDSIDEEGYSQILPELKKRREIILGGWVNGQDFEKYLKEMKPSLRKYLKVLKNSGLWKGLYGEDMNNVCWEFSDGKIISMTWRAFADFRAAVEGKKESYLRYYMRM